MFYLLFYISLCRGGGGQGTQKPARIPVSTLGVGTPTPKNGVSTHLLFVTIGRKHCMVITKPKNIMH